ncbi:Protein of unknown function [Propionibacterium freudenreichii]|nr:Protein of unknown function [Propionibacterium freudenreichii subsp. freudenreichii]CEG89370.1 Protein of unknown function [Propionibacterium freudenreichii]CEH02243.1 Protein of unknown function [Propionibacterium freudenreichii]CEI25404.1 Protein of unknown function [Propionibacterium freudenreichii]CEI30035.1 Protein of unknown function [Propionibacterium freudenreichii]
MGTQGLREAPRILEE